METMETSGNGSTNLTSVLIHSEESSVGLASFGIILAIWIIFINGALIIGIMVRKSRRVNMFLIHIVNIAVADIFVGILVLPIAADVLLQGNWKLGQEACQFWVITDILMCTVSIIAVVMVSCDRFIYLVWPQFYSPGWKQYILGSIMILIPWVVGLGLVLPIWLNGQATDFYMPDNDGVCFVLLRQEFQIVSCFVSFFVPTFLAICMNVAFLMMLFVYRKQWHARGDLPSAKRPARQMLTVGLVGLVFTVMWIPFFVFMLLQSIHAAVFIPAAMFDFAIWLGYANSGVTPLLWLIYPLVRESYLDLVCCRKTKVEKPAIDDTRRSMIEEQPLNIEMRDM